MTFTDHSLSTQPTIDANGPGNKWPDQKIQPEPARKFWVSKKIFSTRTQNKPNLKNLQIFGSHPTWTETHPLNPNIISLFFDSFKFFIVAILGVHIIKSFKEVLYNYCIILQNYTIVHILFLIYLYKIISYTTYNRIILENGYKMTQNNLRKLIKNKINIKNIELIRSYF